MIPKIIHYIWLGGEMPLKVKKVIEHNQQFFDDYEVKIWTEENMPPLNAFAKQAYEEERWAFVSDYLRFYILYHEGGIYLDTDMEVLNPLDELLEHSFFSGWDRTGKYIYAGIIGANLNHSYIASIIDNYNTLAIGVYPTSPKVMTDCYLLLENKDDLKIYDSSYFYPLLDGEKKREALMKNAYTNHLWFESWRNFVKLRRLLRRVGLMKIYHYFLFKLKGIK